MNQRLSNDQFADSVIKNGRLVNVLTGEIYEADIAIKGSYVLETGNVEDRIHSKTKIIDAQGYYLTPGLIDQHVHTYESQLSISEYAAAVIPHGTTAIVTDFYGETAVAGKEAARFEIDLAKLTPLKVLFGIGICAFYQDNPFGHSGVPTEEDMLEMLDWSECIGTNDTFATKIIEKDSSMETIIKACMEKGKQVCGHASEIRGEKLNDLVIAVPNINDHECVTAEEAVEKARLGVYVAMREGSGCSNVEELCKAITKYGLSSRRFCFCTDLRSPMDIMETGHINQAVRIAIKSGVEPVEAIQMASINAAECLKVDDSLGSITPGKYADILLVENLQDFNVKTVIANGEVVAQGGELTVKLPENKYPDFAYGTVQLPAKVQAKDFKVVVDRDLPEAKIRVMKCSGNSLIAEEEHEIMNVIDGELKADLSRDILKVAAIERVTGSGEMGKGFIKGFGLRKGAIASTYNPQQQNLLVVGTNDDDMAVAVNHLADIGGGFVVVNDGDIIAELELPLFGLLSDQSLATVIEDYKKVYQAVSDLGSSLKAPFHTLAFVGLPITIGNIKISTKGLVDVWKEEVVDLIIK